MSELLLLLNTWLYELLSLLRAWPCKHNRAFRIFSTNPTIARMPSFCAVSNGPLKHPHFGVWGLLVLQCGRQAFHAIHGNRKNDCVMNLWIQLQLNFPIAKKNFCDLPPPPPCSFPPSLGFYHDVTVFIASWNSNPRFLNKENFWSSALSLCSIAYHWNLYFKCTIIAAVSIWGLLQLSIV